MADSPNGGVEGVQALIEKWRIDARRLHRLGDHADADAKTACAAELEALLALRPQLVVPRYDLITNYRAGSSIEEMERADDGEWVRYEDVEVALRPQRDERIEGR